MPRISFRVNLIELKDSTLHSINPSSLIRLNVTQKPSSTSEEYILKNVNCLADVNHEFIVDDPYCSVDTLSMTVRSVFKKTTLASIFGLEEEHQKPKDTSIDRFVGGFRENRKNNVECEYWQNNHSLIGFCQVHLNEIEVGINNSLRYKLITKKGDIVGYVNFDIYIWDNASKTNEQQKIASKNTGPILFVDPGCPQPAIQPY